MTTLQAETSVPGNIPVFRSTLRATPTAVCEHPIPSRALPKEPKEEEPQRDYKQDSPLRPDEEWQYTSEQNCYATGWTTDAGEAYGFRCPDRFATLLTR